MIGRFPFPIFLRAGGVMPNELAVLAIPAGGVVTLGLVGVGLWRKTGPPPSQPASGREDQLARQLAGMVGCAPVDALPAVQREIAIAPDQTDETLLKRAAYHYRKNLPDAPCPVWRGGRPG